MFSGQASQSGCLDDPDDRNLPHSRCQSSENNPFEYGKLGITDRIQFREGCFAKPNSRLRNYKFLRRNIRERFIRHWPRGQRSENCGVEQAGYTKTLTEPRHVNRCSRIRAILCSQLTTSTIVNALNLKDRIGRRGADYQHCLERGQDVQRRREICSTLQRHHCKLTGFQAGDCD